MADYHETELAILVGRVGAAVDGFRGGRLSAFDVDRVLWQYSRAAKALWTFCNVGDPDVAASMVRDGVRVDWWERAAPRPLP